MKHSLRLALPFAALLAATPLVAQPAFDGLGLGLGNLSRLSRAKTRSISPESFTGEKGKAGMATEGTGAKAARDLGQGWKVSPSVRIKPKTDVHDGRRRGAGRHPAHLDDADRPLALPDPALLLGRRGRRRRSRCRPATSSPPAGAATRRSPRSPVCVNPGSAFNSYWEMPFRKGFRVTAENLGDDEMTLYYQIDYTLTEVPKDAAYFHAQFRRVNPLPEKEVYTILDGVRGQGHYVGTYLAWGVNSNGWWGEGEIKFYLDGDREFPTIGGTGTEDYFGGSYNFENQATKRYQEFTTPYSGLVAGDPAGRALHLQQRFGLYRWHIMDPVRFESDLRVTIQALGWRADGRYQLLRDDIASVAYWYQAEPHAPFPALPPRDVLELK